jgi:hypothetical protein
MKIHGMMAGVLSLLAMLGAECRAAESDVLELMPGINASGDSIDWLAKRGGQPLELDATPHTYRIGGGAEGKYAADPTFTIREVPGAREGVKLCRLTTDTSTGVSVSLPDGITLDVPGHTTIDVDFGTRYRMGVGAGALAAGAGPIHAGQPLRGTYEVTVLPMAERLTVVADPKAVGDGKVILVNDPKEVSDPKDVKDVKELPGIASSPVVGQQSGSAPVVIQPGSSVAFPASGVAGYMPPISHYAFAQGLYGPYVFGGVPVETLKGRRPRRGGPGSASEP